MTTRRHEADATHARSILRSMNKPPRQRRSDRRDISGWLVFDKPVGMTSTNAVSRIKHAFNAKKAGHAGTLDPLASGLLPIALGEATKTVPFVQDGEKAYRFTVRWGVQTSTDDTEGEAIAKSDLRPSDTEVQARLPSFVGTIQQTPPAFSAIKIAGERAYDLARDGEVVTLQARTVTVNSLDLIRSTPDEAVFEARCGKGTYVRAIARDLGLALGCYGHVTALRRTRVGPFGEDDAVAIERIEDAETVASTLLPVEAGLNEVACVPVNRADAVYLRRGQPLILRGHGAPSDGMAFASCGGVVVAFGPIEQGALQPYRVFNLPF